MLLLSPGPLPARVEHQAPYWEAAFAAILRIATEPSPQDAAGETPVSSPLSSTRMHLTV